jgi:hypothetical protein
MYTLMVIMVTISCNVRDHDQEIQILREDDTLLKQYFNVTRSAPHRLLVFGLSHFPANSKFPIFAG